jgi:hypothetical protein
MIRLAALLVTFSMLLCGCTSTPDTGTTAGARKARHGHALPRPGDDLDLLARITGRDFVFGSRLAESQRSLGILDRVLDSEATRTNDDLARLQHGWRPSTPGWKEMRQQIRADYESDKETLLQCTAASADQMQRPYLMAVAGVLSPEDLAAIVAYYARPEGQRYERLLRRLDVMVALYAYTSYLQARNDLRTWESNQDNRNLTPQQRRYADILRLSHPIQEAHAAARAAEAAHQDPTPYAAREGIAGMQGKTYAPELEAILGEYGADLPAFAAYQQTAPAQHLFAAMGAGALADISKQDITNGCLAGWEEAVHKKHAAEWQAQYAHYRRR